MEMIPASGGFALVMLVVGLVVGGVLTALGLHLWRKTDEAGYQEAAAKAKKFGDKA